LAEIENLGIQELKQAMKMEYSFNPPFLDP
jgi:hypothetical protein